MVAEDATEREEQEALLSDVRDFERTLHAVLLGEQPPKARCSDGRYSDRSPLTADPPDVGGEGWCSRRRAGRAQAKHHQAGDVLWPQARSEPTRRQ